MITILRLLLFFAITMGYDAFFRNALKMNRRLTSLVSLEEKGQISKVRYHCNRDDVLSVVVWLDALEISNSAL